MIQTETLGVASDTGVLLLDSSDLPVNGVVYTDVAVTYRKNGDSGFTTKTLLSGEWSDRGDGLYRLSLSAAELDRAGSFRYLVKHVSGPTFLRYENEILVVENYQDIANHIIAIKQELAGKANIRDVNLLFNQVELRVRELEMQKKELGRRLSMAEASLAALRAE
ncbi:MAG TPA: hypothetical protein VMY98_02355 [Anaerolineae bacterium]|nr:hypothetical protein [Anaerolineae bacterium]